MAQKIVDVNLTTNYTWADIKDYKSWEIVKNTNSSYDVLFKTSKVSQNIKIEVEVMEGTWELVKEILPTWEFIINKFTSWNELKGW